MVVGGYLPLPIFRFVKCQNLVLSLRNWKKKKVLLSSVRTSYFISDLDERGKQRQERVAVILWSFLSYKHGGDSSSS